MLPERRRGYLLDVCCGSLITRSKMPMVLDAPSNRALKGVENHLRIMKLISLRLETIAVQQFVSPFTPQTATLTSQSPKTSRRDNVLHTRSMA